jgi:2-oxoglutarate ferredoxin oxidoreductase subunit alpha
VTVWPFPDDQIRALAARVNALVVPEINMGQIVREVERCAAGQAEVFRVSHPGGGIHDPQQVLSTLRQAAGSGT